MSILIIVGVALMGWMLGNNNRGNSVTVHIEAGETQQIKFDHIGLIPGEACEYSIELKGKENLVLGLDFVEKEEKSLKNYAFVKIIANEEIVFDELLADAFEQAWRAADPELFG